jgi:putative membrane protein
VSRLSCAALLSAPAFAAAHATGHGDAMQQWWRWNLDPWLGGTLLLGAFAYGRGTLRLAGRAGEARGITIGQRACFVAGWLLLVLALFSPLDALGERLFWVHMVQHELLMAVAAPLLVLSRPLEALAWGIPRAAARPMGRLHRLGDPIIAWTLHALAIWAWHVPLLFNLALADEGVHKLQHASFFVTGLLFWHSLWRRTGHPREGVALASLFTTMLHMGVLGALLTFAATPWYAFPATQAHGLTALEDQQLGGLVMWVPGGLPYLVAALAIVGRYIGGGDTRSEVNPPPTATRALLAFRRKRRGTSHDFGPRSG